MPSLCVAASVVLLFPAILQFLFLEDNKVVLIIRVKLSRGFKQLWRKGYMTSTIL